MKGRKKLFAAIVAALVLLLVLTAGGRQDKPSQDPLSGNLYWISNTSSSTVSVIDLDARKVAKTIDLTKEAGRGNTARQSHFIAITNDSKFLLVGEALGRPEGKILFVDTQTNKVVKKFDVGAAIGLHLSHDGRWLFSVSSAKGTVNGVNYTNVINIFDVDKQEYLGKIDHGADPHVLETTRDSRTLYTTTAYDGKLVAYDITGLPSTIPSKPSWTFDVYQNLKNDGHVTDPNQAGVTLHALAVHPNGRHVIVGSFDFYLENDEWKVNPLLNGGGDIIVDVQTNKIVARIPGRPHNYDISPDNHYLLSGEAFNPDCEEEKYLYKEGFTKYTGPLVRLVNISELQSPSPDYSKITIDHTIDAGALGGTGALNHQSYDSSGRYILVTSSGSGLETAGHVLIVDSQADYNMVAHLQVGKDPHGVSYPGHGR